MLSKELQEQWHVNANERLGPGKVTPGSGIMAVWQCNECPAGQPHVWKATVGSRTRGARCPYCSNRRVCLHNSLATVAPDATQYWHHSKNEKAPEQVLAGSSFRAEWKCPTCQWEWQAPVALRVLRKAGCPKCSQALVVKQRHPTFAVAQPPELDEWDYERNNTEGFYLNDTTLGSHRLVHWICSQCPRGQPHRWRAPPYSRVGHGTGCAVCVGMQSCVCNSLESLFPSVAAELDVDRNGFAASEVTAQTHQKVWWRNTQRGSWRQAVDARTTYLRASANIAAGLATLNPSYLTASTVLAVYTLLIISYSHENERTCSGS